MKWNEKETAAKWTENENNNKIIYIVNYLKMVLRLNLNKKEEEDEEEIFMAKYSSLLLFWRLAESFSVRSSLFNERKCINCVHPVYCTRNCSIHKT